MKGFVKRLQERHRMIREGLLGTRKRRDDSASEATDRSVTVSVSLVVLLLIVCMAVLTLPEMRNYPELVLNQLAPSTIYARVDFSYKDEAATQQERDKAAATQPQYLLISQTHNEQISKRWQNLLKFMHERRVLESQKQVFSAPETPVAREIAALSPSAFLALSRLDEDTLLREQFQEELNRICQDGFIDLSKLSNQSPASAVRISDSVGRDRRERPLKTLRTCKESSEQLAKLILSFTPEQKAAALDKIDIERLMSTLLGSDGNLLLDQKRTEEKQQKASQAVKPVMKEVSKNDVIIRRNKQVSQMVLDALAAQKAVIDMQDQEENFWQNFLNNLFWSLIMIMFAGFYLAHIHPEITRRSLRIALIVTVSAVSLGINYLAMEAFYFFSGVLDIPPDLITNAIPLALPAVLLTVMAGYRVALYIGFFAAMITTLMLNAPFTMALEGFVLSAVCGLLVRPSANYRSYFLRAFFCVAITVWLLDFNMLWHITSAPQILLFSLGLAVANALFTAITAMLLTFLFELLFKVSTNMSLMVLCDCNHPLLKELLLRAPGTYLHSQNVAMLAENAAMKIGANAVLARAGALFHDIGKLKNPKYFIENNQNGSNPHDEISPRMSSLIISNHVKDGLDMAMKYKLCRAVRQFIKQHHGNDLIQYFYHKAKESGEQVSEQEYRYPGQLPHEKEVVIVSLADACEAASRSLDKATSVNIETLVNDIFRKRWRDGQLNGANLTIEELSLINKSFTQTLITMYHDRIPYPKDANDHEDNLLIPERPATGTEPQAPAPGNE